MPDSPDPRYPIGDFVRPDTPLDSGQRAAFIDDLARLPDEVRALVNGLSDSQLDTRYRPEGWTIRQVVHHVPDSHMNAYIRMKLAMTEESPLIRTYMEERWAELPDGKGPIAMSLNLLDALHCRWVAFLRGMPASEFARPYVHPQLGSVPVDAGLALYVWHGKHHCAHIRQALAR